MYISNYAIYALEIEDTCKNCGEWFKIKEKNNSSLAKDEDLSARKMDESFKAIGSNFPSIQ